MADVLIVCVREDEPQAKALADMFEAAGFSIGGAPGSDAALRSSGAGVVVWSQASIRSRPFLDAAQRVINAGKAVVASLIEPPPPASVGDAPTFDLSGWNGDPDDSALDPLFFAVDRMVNSARAAVGAPVAQPAQAAYEPPPSLRTPAPPRPQPPRPAPPPAPADPLGAEAEHWKSIRNSRDPAVFMDYLARYGADGAFAEVAELRLKQLTGAAGETRQRPIVAAAAPPRLERRPEPPLRRPEPPPRRAEAAAPPPRRDPPPPAYERRYERAEMREPPRSEGGALRAFVLIALLGGAGLAGALYFGGNIGAAPQAQEETVDVASTPPVGLDEPADAPVGESGSDIEDVLAPPPAPRRETQPPPQQQRAERQTAEEPPTPAPTANFNVAENSQRGGPVSLAPGATTPSNSGASAVVPLTPPPAVEPQQSTPVAATPSEAATARRTGAVQWANRPSARVISSLYPSRAMREGVGGRVELDCTVLSNLSLACSIASESPPGLGFGRAAMSAAGAYRARPALSDGSSSVGARTRIAVMFQAPAQ